MAESPNTTKKLYQQHRYNRDMAESLNTTPSCIQQLFNTPHNRFRFQEKFLTFKSILMDFLIFSNFDESRKKWRKQ